MLVFTVLFVKPYSSTMIARAFALAGLVVVIMVMTGLVSPIVSREVLPIIATAVALGIACGGGVVLSERTLVLVDKNSRHIIHSQPDLVSFCVLDHGKYVMD